MVAITTLWTTTRCVTLKAYARIGYNVILALNLHIYIAVEVLLGVVVLVVL